MPSASTADSPAARVLVIGYGSALHGDDALGHRVAEAIEQRAIDNVDVIAATQLLPEFVDPISTADTVIFVDASLAVDDVTTSRLAAVTPASPTDSHHATPSALLDLAASLHDRRPLAHLVEVPAFDLTLGDQLSEPGAGALDDAIEHVLSLVRTCQRR